MVTRTKSTSAARKTTHANREVFTTETMPWQRLSGPPCSKIRGQLVDHLLSINSDSRALRQSAKVDSTGAKAGRSWLTPGVLGWESYPGGPQPLAAPFGSNIRR